MGLTAMRRRNVKKKDELSKAQKERAAKADKGNKKVESENNQPDPKKKKGFFGGIKR